MNSEEALLIVIENSKDEQGFPTQERKEYSAYVTELSVNRNEFYSAMKVDIQPKIILELRIEDWEQTKRIVNNKVEYASQVKYDGCIYDIVRSYKKNRSKVQITLM